MKTQLSELAQLQHLFRALADTTRLRILGLLLTGEVCVCHIHETLGIPQPKASRHLAYLRRAKLVEGRRDGLWIHYRLAQPSGQVIGAIQEGVRHVLGHVTDVRNDLKALRRKTGCCVPALGDAPVLSCCGRDAGGSKPPTSVPRRPTGSRPARSDPGGASRT